MVTYRILAALALIGCLTGCTALMLGGAGGSPANEQPVTAEQDGTTSAAIRRAFAADPVVSADDVHIETRAGQVTLSGMVDTWAARARAGRIAAGVAGVRSVDNRIEVADGARR